MPPKRQQPRAAKTHELEAFAEKYDTLALMYGDPVEVVFAIMGRAVRQTVDEDGNVRLGDDELALSAANTLMSYRYPRIKAAEPKREGAALMQFNVIMPGDKKPEMVDVTPRRPMLVVTPEKP